MRKLEILIRNAKNHFNQIKLLSVVKVVLCGACCRYLSCVRQERFGAINSRMVSPSFSMSIKPISFEPLGGVMPKKRSLKGCHLAIEALSSLG